MSERMNSQIESTPTDPAILIEHDVIERSPLSESPETWIAKYAEKYRDLWEKNKELFLETYEKNPEELYGLISQLLETSE